MKKLLLALLLLALIILPLLGSFIFHKTKFGCEVLQGGEMKVSPLGCYPSCPNCKDCGGKGPVEFICITR